LYAGVSRSSPSSEGWLTTLRSSIMTFRRRTVARDLSVAAQARSGSTILSADASCQSHSGPGLQQCVRDLMNMHLLWQLH
jgi:hypothetical protein